MPPTGAPKLGRWALLPLLWLLLLAGYFLASPSATAISYSDFRAKLAAGQVERVTVSPTRIRGTLKAEGPAGKSFETVRIEDDELLRTLREQGVDATGREASTSWSGIAAWLLPLGLLGLLFLAFRARGAGPGFMTVGKSKARIYVEKEVKVTFADVAGVDEAKDELREVIEFLRTPARFGRLGGKIPKGVLLVGPPGTGKTLLARAVAGEAAVRFFSISGSEFVEMFVGVGAARVRDLFAQARAMAPCIVFIDELDALGKARGLGPASHEEREQTLNQLLVELDGFDPRGGVILMAATNRPEILDPALLRAGRFDRHVLVDRPDKAGRRAILAVHARGVTMGPDADLDALAAMTPGLVGADLANLVNEAALLAVRRDKAAVGMAELQEGVERVIAGLEKRNRVLNRAERERVAHHEIGHALVALALPGLDPVHKISIIPRGISALGYTLQLPTEDRFLMTQGELEDKLAMLLGGRVAEQLIYGDVSTGAEDDLTKATDIARNMVTHYGMSKAIGHVTLERDRTPYLDVGAAVRRGFSEATARDVDLELRRILDAQHARVTKLLGAQVDVLRTAARALLAEETLSGDALRALVRRAGPDRPPARPSSANPPRTDPLPRSRTSRS